MPNRELSGAARGLLGVVRDAIKHSRPSGDEFVVHADRFLDMEGWCNELRAALEREETGMEGKDILETVYERILTCRNVWGRVPTRLYIGEKELILIKKYLEDLETFRIETGPVDEIPDSGRIGVLLDLDVFRVIGADSHFFVC